MTLFWEQFYSLSTSQHFEYSEYFETDSAMPTPAPVWQETRSQAWQGVTKGHPASSLPTCFPHPSPCCLAAQMGGQRLGGSLGVSGGHSSGAVSGDNPTSNPSAQLLI